MMRPDVRDALLVRAAACADCDRVLVLLRDHVLRRHDERFEQAEFDYIVALHASRHVDTHGVATAADAAGGARPRHDPLKDKAWLYECSCERSQSHHYPSVEEAARRGRTHVQRCPWHEPKGRPKAYRVRGFPSGVLVGVWYEDD